MYLRLEEYHRPDDLEACLGLLEEPDTTVIAGGTRLNVAGHEEVRQLVDLQALGLDQIEVGERQVRLGAMVTLAELANAELPEEMAAAAIAALEERNLPLRNRSTLGGRLSRHASDGRLATALLALGAQVEVAQSSGSEVLPLRDWLQRESDDRRLLTHVLVPRREGWSGYLGFSQPVLTPPACDAALFVDKQGVRVTSGGHGPDAKGTLSLPRTADKISWLKPGTPTSEWEQEIRKLAGEEIPEYSNALAAGDWRRQVAVTLIVRLTETWLQQGGAA